MGSISIIYILLGVVLIISVIILTIVIARFFEHYRQTLKQADFTIRTAEKSLHDVDLIIDTVTSRIADIEYFLAELRKTGQNLEMINDKFNDIISFFRKFPKGFLSSVVLLERLDVVQGLSRLFGRNEEFDEELNSMLKDFLKGAIVGGLVVAYLTPKTGEEMRKITAEKLDELREKAKQINVDDVRNQILDKIDELKQFVQTSSKEEIVDRIFDEFKRLYEKILEFLPISKKPRTEIIDFEKQ